MLVKVTRETFGENSLSIGITADMFTDLKSRKKIYIYTEIEEFKTYDTAESGALIS